MRRRHAVRPILEPVEDRCLLSAIAGMDHAHALIAAHHPRAASPMAAHHARGHQKTAARAAHHHAIGHARHAHHAHHKTSSSSSSNSFMDNIKNFFSSMGL